MLHISHIYAIYLTWLFKLLFVLCRIFVINNFAMKKAFALICYNLGLWGVLGFFATLIIGFVSCCANLSSNIFYGFLILFAIVGVTATTICVFRGCKKAQ